MSNAFSFPSKAGAARGRGGRGSHGAGGRANPYSRPAPAASGAADGKWTHDLFGEKSDLYNPTLNVSHVRQKLHLPAAEASPSLRPFGAATPAAQPLLRAAGLASAPAAAPAAPALGIKGQGAAAHQREAARQANLARIAQQKEREERAALLRERKVLEQKRQAQIQISKEEELGFVVQVEGLVNGTSAEDVQTAFGAYGEIRYCYIIDETAADLQARLTFTRHADASDACAKLECVTRSYSNRRGAAAPAAAPAPAPAAPSRMYADQIEAAQQQAASSSAMDVDMAAPAAAGPRGRGAARAHGGAAAPAAAAPANPLMARLGVPTGPRNGATQPRGQGAARQQQQQQPQGLAARLGGVPGKQQQGGKGGKGGGARGAASQGNSLLARLT
ncbi:hypothetical protein Rhopal_005282-T1 [Rhodotorula paludigena]|uniref:RRM domain-containing protein n=1 Tax=Rhodotorula paludigena TaxID=86838 RepID=A0AAV5GRY4_9BASI|nr:hypothetical protein Rhopal_005282-T1 [Rhodotorula paludigena]